MADVRRQLAARPGGQTARQVGVHRARVFIGNRCVLGSSLVVPAWVLWKAFEEFGQEHGFEASAACLRELLDAAPWAELVERPLARGRLKAIVRGVGLKP